MEANSTTPQTVVVPWVWPTSIVGRWVLAALLVLLALSEPYWDVQQGRELGAHTIIWSAILCSIVYTFVWAFMNTARFVDAKLSNATLVFEPRAWGWLWPQSQPWRLLFAIWLGAWGGMFGRSALAATGLSFTLVWGVVVAAMLSYPVAWTVSSLTAPFHALFRAKDTDDA